MLNKMKKELWKLVTIWKNYGLCGKKMLYTLKKQRQRARIKEDPVCLAEAHRKDRERKKERKKKSRQARKEYLEHHHLLRRQKEREKRLEMRIFREKIKESQVTQ